MSESTKICLGESLMKIIKQKRPALTCFKNTATFVVSTFLERSLIRSKASLSDILYFLWEKYVTLQVICRGTADSFLLLVTYYATVHLL